MMGQNAQQLHLLGCAACQDYQEDQVQAELQILAAWSAACMACH